jgi:hypothetical protein
MAAYDTGAHTVFYHRYHIVWIQVAQPAQAEPPENPAHGGGRDAKFGSDPLARPALAAPSHDPVHDLVRGRAVKTVRARRTVAQPRLTFRLEARHPLAHGLDADAERSGNLARRLAKIDNAADKFCSTQCRQARILMTVHPVLPGTLKHHNSSFLDQDRVDNLLKAHI